MLASWGLLDRVGAVTADNAAPNDVMIVELAKTVDNFLGKAMHIRCFDHSLNLMAKVSMLPFQMLYNANHLS